MDDILEHKGRREIAPLAKSSVTISICDCGSGLPADRTDLRFRSSGFRCCAECYPAKTDILALGIEEEIRDGLYAQKVNSDGTFVSAPYKIRSIQEIVAAHTAPATPEDTEPVRI